MHPLAGNIGSLKDTEIENKINDLTRKYFMTKNFGIQQQISALLDTYKDELGKRRREEYEKMMNSRDKGLDKLININ
jgi:hypothetical protein